MEDGYEEEAHNIIHAIHTYYFIHPRWADAHPGRTDVAPYSGAWIEISLLLTIMGMN